MVCLKFTVCLRACLNQLFLLCIFFSAESYHFHVKENEPEGFKIGIIDIKDFDENQNKNPIFTVDGPYKTIFDVDLNNNNDGVLIIKKVVFLHLE